MLPAVPCERPGPMVGDMRPYFGGFGQVPMHSVTQKYMRGDCGYFALALHQKMPGSQLWELGGHHFVVEDPNGSFWDVRGQLTVEQAWFGVRGQTMRPLSRKELITELDTGVFGDARFTPSREARARADLQALWCLSTAPQAIQRRPGPR